MNKVILCGRFTRDPEVRYTQSENPTAIANFTIAVDRRYKQQGGPSADFINCVAFGKTGEHVEKYYRKGMKTILEGRIQTRSYENREGNKVYVTEVVAENMEFAESKAASQGSQGGAYAPQGGYQSYAQPQTQAPRQDYAQDSLDGFMSIPDGIDDELPFN